MNKRSILVAITLIVFSFGFISCSKDDEDKESTTESVDNLKGYWIMEDALSASGGFTGGFGRYFPGNGTVIRFHMDSDDSSLPNKVSFRGHTFYYENPRSSRAVPYIIDGKEFIINSSNDPDYCRITGTNSFVGSDGTWSRFKK